MRTGWFITLLVCSACAVGQEIRVTQIVSGIAAPTDIQHAGDGSGRLFLVQQNGIIRIWRGGALLPDPFLDIRQKTTGMGERGLLGLAFPPSFPQSRRFYVNYTDLNGDTIIAQYRLSGNANAADAGSEIVLLRIPQPYPNHNGGQLRFGPDGFLYIGMGDGGAGGDPQGYAQRLNTLLGKMLRIDVESNPGSVQIPSSNPFINQAGARGEIWAFGLRNPWRFTFDRVTKDMWIADVGQDTYEEVDFQPASSAGGENYGWNRTEGRHCFPPQSGCNMQGLTLPVAEYTHAEGACSVTGGFVYRGSVSLGLRGVYVYGDLCNGRIWGVERQGDTFANRLLLNSGFSITTFGEDEAGEMYVSNALNGTIHRIEGSTTPRLSATSVVNPASFQSGVTAGSLATVFGSGVKDTAGTTTATTIPLPTTLGGVQVTVNGTAAPILALANVDGREQVNFQVPFSLAGATSASVVLNRGGQASTPATVSIFETQPAIYTSNGTQAVVVHNAGFRLVNSSDPLERGEYAFFYATGLGRVSNEPQTGAAAAASPLSRTSGNVRVTLAGQPCDIQFAGLAPGFVGVYQVNFQVPSSTPSGSHPLDVSVGTAQSPTVMVSVR